MASGAAQQVADALARAAPAEESDGQNGSVVRPTLGGGLGDPSERQLALFSPSGEPIGTSGAASAGLMAFSAAQSFADAASRFTTGSTRRARVTARGVISRRVCADEPGICSLQWRSCRGLVCIK